MKVIFLKDVRGSGRAGEVKDVAEGYARNFLLPNKFAEAATQEKVAKLEAQKEAREAERRKEEENRNAAVAALRGNVVRFSVRATEKGGLFKQITPSDIVRGLREQHQATLSEDAVHLAAPIKTIGAHPATLRSGPASADITVEVAAQ